MEGGDRVDTDDSADCHLEPSDLDGLVPPVLCSVTKDDPTRLPPVSTL
jgi:hypothetical protein